MKYFLWALLSLLISCKSFKPLCNNKYQLPRESRVRSNARFLQRLGARHAQDDDQNEKKLTPLSPRDNFWGSFISNLRLIAGSVVASVAAGMSRPKPASASIDDINVNLDESSYRKAPVNIQSDDFWYPPYMIGRWNTTMKFAGAKFSNEIPVEILAKDDNVPGFSKYSVIFAPDMGKDITNLTLRYVQLDSHPREDHPFNLRGLVQAFMSSDGAVVDSAPYAFQKAPDWFHSPSNKWKIKYHDNKGNGVIDLLTLKRNITLTAGSVETVEFIRQTHRRQENVSLSGSSPPKVVVGDYALRWRLSVPASLRDEFVTVTDLARTSRLIGSLDILVYLQPNNDLYFKAPGKPVGVFSYDVVMDRLGGDASEEVAKTEYPFVWRDAGPVELQDYFGY